MLSVDEFKPISYFRSYSLDVTPQHVIISWPLHKKRYTFIKNILWSYYIAFVYNIFVYTDKIEPLNLHHNLIFRQHCLAFRKWRCYERSRYICFTRYTVVSRHWCNSNITRWCIRLTCKSNKQIRSIVARNWKNFKKAFADIIEWWHIQFVFQF